MGRAWKIRVDILFFELRFFCSYSVAVLAFDHPLVTSFFIRTIPR